MWVATEAHDGGAAAVRDALDRVRPSVVIAAGGDGTVSVVAGALGGSDVPLAIVPIGTTNLFARAVASAVSGRGVGRRLDAAVSRAFSGVAGRVDLGRFRATFADGSVVERPFTVMVGAGIDAAMVADTHPLGKERLGWLGYVQGISASILRNERFGASVAIDDRPAARERAHTVVVANGGLLPAGLVFVPGAVVDDGALDVMVLRPRGPVSWGRLTAWFASSAVRAPGRVGRGLAGPVVSVDRAARTSIVFDEPQRAEADGEELGLVTRLDAWIEPHALRVAR